MMAIPADLFSRGFAAGRDGLTVMNMTRGARNGHWWLPNMNGMAIAYASQPRLRTRLTLRRLT